MTGLATPCIRARRAHNAPMLFVSHMEDPDDPYVEAHWFIVRRGDVLIEEGPEGLRIPLHRGDPPIEGYARHVIGSLRGVLSYAVDAGEDTTEEPSGYRWMPLRGLFGQIDEVTWTAAGRAEQIVAWDRTNRYCGRCGAETGTDRRHVSERQRSGAIRRNQLACIASRVCRRNRRAYAGEPGYSARSRGLAATCGSWLVCMSAAARHPFGGGLDEGVAGG